MSAVNEALWPHQVAARNGVGHAWKNGPSAVCLVIPTGGGKTRVGIDCALAAHRRGMRTLWLVHRRELVDQAGKRAIRDGMPSVGLWMDGKPSTNPDAPLQIAGVQTLSVRGARPDADLVIVDECFVAGSLIETDNGAVPVEQIQVGSVVLSFNERSKEIEPRRVVRLFRSRSKALVRVRLQDGRSFVCTPKHPFFIKGAWRDAIDLQPGEQLFDLQCFVRKQEDMQPRMPAEMVLGTHGSNEQTRSLHSNDQAKSNEERRVPRENESHAPANWSSSGRARRQRKATDTTSASIERSTSGSVSNNGISRADGARGQASRLLDSLQNRSSDSVGNDRDRSGRPESSGKTTNASGPPQERVLENSRVDRVEILEPGSDGRYGGLCADGYVYNFEVEGNNNYFVDGILVHNCHHATAATHRAIVEAYPGAFVLGLTATPERTDGTALGNVFSHLVAPVSIRELIAAGTLVPCDVIAPEKATKALSMCPVAAYQAHANGERAVVFVDSVVAARELAQQYTDAGIAAGFVDGSQSVTERDAVLARFKSGALRVLVNVFVLTEGYDDPSLSVCILARGCGSAGMFLQIVGRVLRAAAGKQRALLIDLRGAVHRHGLPDEDRVYSLEGKPIRKTQNAIRLSRCKECGAVFRVATECPRCGMALATKAGQAIKNTKLAKIDRVASSEEKLAAWKRFCLHARTHGWKPGSAAHRFKAVFGHWPERSFPTYSQVCAQERAAWINAQSTERVA